ncbi:hypothetical protein [Azohydromonas aeria]|uniref:hypothetical protein n=1 Tax=Azohydromonas aeria TaxID=2590212 RepID=UPI0012FA7B12|nr:hypothetical protein [Azohydromonas aeria]
MSAQLQGSPGPALARTPHTARWATPAIVLGLVLVPMLFGDRQGFEGDGLALLFGMSQFEALGRLGVYRYHWQPLSYELLSALYPLLHRPFDLTYVAQGFGGAGLALLYLLLRRMLRVLPFPRSVALALTLAVAEIWVTTLYFNTSALGLPFIAGALLLVHAACDGVRPRPALAVAGGASFALGCLFRLDFAALALTALALLLVWAPPRARLRLALAFVAGGLATALAFLAWQPGFLRDAAAILQRYGAGEFTVSMAYRLKIVLFSMGPALLVFPLLGWAAHRHGGPARAGRLGAWLLLGAAVLPTLAPLHNLYSGKYLLPFFLWLTVAVAQALAWKFQPGLPAGTAGPGTVSGSGAPQFFRAGVALPLGILATLALVGIPAPEALKQRPLAAWTENPLIVGTHDGARSAGGYVGFLRQMDNFELPQNSVLFTRQLSEAVKSCGADVTVLMSPIPKYGHNDWSWGWLPLYLMQSGWRLREYSAGHDARLEQPGSGRQVLILGSGDPQPASAPRRVFDLSKIGTREDYLFWSDAIRWLQAPATRAICGTGQ